MEDNKGKPNSFMKLRRQAEKRLLGLKRTTLESRMKKLGIARPK